MSGDGVLYLPLGVELNIYRDDLTKPGLAALVEIILADRPHDEGKLQCLYCLRKGNGVQWGALRRCSTSERYLYSFQHRTITIQEHRPPPPPISPKHRYLVDREVSVIERVGVDVVTEKATKSRRAIPDFTTRGGAVDLAGEVQVTRQGADYVARRTKVRFADGLTPIWMTDDPDPIWIEKGPRAVIGPTTAQRIQAGTDLLVVGGARATHTERCRWDGKRCPQTGRLYSCGKRHEYLTPAQGLDLDVLVAGIATGDWRLLTQPKTRGGDSRQPAPAPLPTALTQRVQRDAEYLETYARCCGERPVGERDGPLRLSCQLCPNSPTYHRLPRSA